MQRLKKVTNSKPIPPIPLPFDEVISDVLKVKPETKQQRPKTRQAKDRKVTTKR
jgi:hypothetical protein